MLHTAPLFALLSAALVLLPSPQAEKKGLQDDKKVSPEEKKAAQDEKKAQEEAAKKAVDEFTEKIKAAKTLQEKALAILSLGDFEPKDNCMIPALGKYLGATAGDLNYLLVTSAADALGKFRANAKASAVLMSALPGYKKIPYVAAKISTAIGKVGHESALATFEEPFKGQDPDAAAQAVWVIAEFPPTVAMECFFRENERIQKERPKAKPELVKVYDKVQPEMLKAVKKISKQAWLKMEEFQIWYNKLHGKDELLKAEKEKSAGTAPVAARTTLPPVLLVELLFKEGAGTTTANSGASGGLFQTASLTSGKPAWSDVIPPNGVGKSLDFDKMGGVYGVDLGGGAGIENLKNLKSFTITGWTLCWDNKEGASDKMAGAGNRIVSWFNSLKVNEGVELVLRGDGSLQLGIGQWADASMAQSKPAVIPLYDTKATNAGTEQYEKWRFFAVTYDSGPAKDHVKFYVGTRNADAKLINAADYNRGPSGAKISPQLSVGNVPPLIRPMAPERTYRGILDEIRIYGSTLDGSGALPLEELIKIQNRVVPTGA